MTTLQPAPLIKRSHPSAPSQFGEGGSSPELPSLPLFLSWPARNLINRKPARNCEIRRFKPCPGGQWCESSVERHLGFATTAAPFERLESCHEFSRKPPLCCRNTDTTLHPLTTESAPQGSSSILQKDRTGGGTRTLNTLDEPAATNETPITLGRPRRSAKRRGRGGLLRSQQDQGALTSITRARMNSAVADETGPEVRKLWYSYPEGAVAGTPSGKNGVISLMMLVQSTRLSVASMR